MASKEDAGNVREKSETSTDEKAKGPKAVNFAAFDEVQDYQGVIKSSKVIEDKRVSSFQSFTGKAWVTRSNGPCIRIRRHTYAVTKSLRKQQSSKGSKVARPASYTSITFRVNVRHLQPAPLYMQCTHCPCNQALPLLGQHPEGGGSGGR
eukprot:1153698-Pelagomonas_calceolata.AAC.7